MTEFNIKTPRGRALINALAALEWAIDSRGGDSLLTERVLMSFQSNCAKADIGPQGGMHRRAESAGRRATPVTRAYARGQAPCPLRSRVTGARVATRTG
jgi:hypothetical protein